MSEQKYSVDRESIYSNFHTQSMTNFHRGQSPVETQRKNFSPSVDQSAYSSLKTQYSLEQRRHLQTSSRVQSLEKTNSQLQQKLAHKMLKIREYETVSDQYDKEYHKIHSQMEYLEGEKKRLEAENIQLKEYTRKIESKLTKKKDSQISQPSSRRNSLKGQYNIIFQNESFGGHQLQGENDKNLANSNHRGEFSEVEALKYEIQVLKSALDLQKTNFNANSAVTLLELADSREKIKLLNDRETLFKSQLTKSTNEIEKLLLSIQEYQIIRNSDREEMIKLEKEIYDLKIQLCRQEKEPIQSPARSHQSVPSFHESTVSKELASENETMRKKIQILERLIQEEQTQVSDIIVDHEEGVSQKAKLKQLSSENIELQTKLDRQQLKIKQLNENLEKLVFEKEGLRRSLSFIADEEAQNYDGYSSQRQKSIDDLLDSLRQIKEERDQLMEAVNEAVDKCSEYIIKQKQLNNELAQQNEIIQKFNETRDVMQATLLEQIHSLRYSNQNLENDKQKLEDDVSKFQGKQQMNTSQSVTSISQNLNIDNNSQK